MSESTVYKNGVVTLLTQVFAQLQCFLWRLNFLGISAEYKCAFGDMILERSKHFRWHCKSWLLLLVTMYFGALNHLPFVVCRIIAEVLNGHTYSFVACTLVLAFLEVGLEALVTCTPAILFDPRHPGS